MEQNIADVVASASLPEIVQIVVKLVERLKIDQRKNQEDLFA